MGFFKRNNNSKAEPQVVAETDDKQVAEGERVQSEFANFDEQSILDDVGVTEYEIESFQPIVEEKKQLSDEVEGSQFVATNTESIEETAECVDVSVGQFTKEDTREKSEESYQEGNLDMALLVKQIAAAVRADFYHDLERIIAKNSVALVNRTDVSKEMITQLNSVIEQQEQTIRQQHNALLKFQEDVFYKLQKGLIMELIDISDNIRMMLQDNEQQADYDLLGAVEGLNKWLDATLENNSVHRFQDTKEDSTIFNRKRQEVIDREETNDEAKNNTYVSVKPGYVWSIPYLVINSDIQLQKMLSENGVPQQYAFVIRPEQVVKLKYNSNESEK